MFAFVINEKYKGDSSGLYEEETEIVNKLLATGDAHQCSCDKCYMYNGKQCRFIGEPIEGLEGCVEKNGIHEGKVYVYSVEKRKKAAWRKWFK